ncbi:MAG: DNA/RNA helicase domain-containing protein [Verrucomicrobiota bacterium]
MVEDARQNKRKLIIFVTGVPGAGKTLVGLNVATQKRDETQPTHAVFLSGNGPLVAVLREALTRDEVSRLRQRNDKTRKGVVGQKVKAFIQNVHHFRDAGLRDNAAPSDHVVIFDEAQRAWNREMTASFMLRKKKRVGFTQSEPEFLISYLDRHDDWAVIVCLVGGGQEINRGEAGISAWLDAIQTTFGLLWLGRACDLLGMS